MPIFNKQNIDQKTNKPTTIGSPNVTLNRALQTRRDDDVIRSPKRTLYDIDYAIKWFIENDIRPQITADQTLIDIPIIYANGEIMGGEGDDETIGSERFSRAIRKARTDDKVKAILDGLDDL